MLKSNLERMIRRQAASEFRTRVSKLRRELGLYCWKSRTWLFMTGRLEDRKRKFTEKVKVVSTEVENEAMEKYDSLKVE